MLDHFIVVDKKKKKKVIKESELVADAREGEVFGQGALVDAVSSP